MRFTGSIWTDAMNRSRVCTGSMRKWCTLCHWVSVGKSSGKKFHFFRVKEEFALFCVKLLWIAHTRRRNYAVSRKLLRRLFSFFHKRCTLSHWVSVRKGTEKKHNIFEKNHFHHPHTDTHRHTDTQKSCLFTISLLIHNFVINERSKLN